ncbi:hypothetical protein QF017_006326, partial [Pseudomonas laurylsulfatiphila]
MPGCPLRRTCARPHEEAYTATAPEAAYRPAWLLGSFVCEVHVDWPAAIASKLAPTGTQYISKISVGWQTAFASRLAPTGIQYICKISVGWQTAFASRLAPTGIQYICKISVGWQT